MNFKELDKKHCWHPFTQQDEWTATQIKDRGIQLAKRAVSVWPMLKVDPSLIATAEQKEMLIQRPLA